MYHNNWHKHYIRGPAMTPSSPPLSPIRFETQDEVASTGFGFQSPFEPSYLSFQRPEDSPPGVDFYNQDTSTFFDLEPGLAPSSGSKECIVETPAEFPGSWGGNRFNILPEDDFFSPPAPSSYRGVPQVRQQISPSMLNLLPAEDQIHPIGAPMPRHKFDSITYYPQQWDPQPSLMMPEFPKSSLIQRYARASGASTRYSSQSRRRRNVQPSLLMPEVPEVSLLQRYARASGASITNASRSSSPLTQCDVPSCPSLYKGYLCQSFNIEVSEVVDFTDYIDRRRFIAAGGSGEVWEASWTGILNIMPTNPRKAMPVVVVKLIRVPSLGDEVSKDKRYKRMKRELELWSKLNHPNILPLIGIARIEGDANLPAFISPWMENGNVMDFLKKNPSCLGFRFLKDIIKGLHYLHTFDPVIVHGDIKGANVLINNHQEAYLSDFGLSRFIVDNTLWRTTATHATGTLRWMAPELMEEDMVTPTISSDIYSFGMTCYEILSRQVPFGSANDAVVIRKLIHEQRPKRVESYQDLNDDMWSIITQCWAQAPENRPSTEETLNLVLQYDASS